MRITVETIAKWGLRGGRVNRRTSLQEDEDETDCSLSKERGRIKRCRATFQGFGKGEGDDLL